MTSAMCEQTETTPAPVSETATIEETAAAVTWQRPYIQTEVRSDPLSFHVEMSIWSSEIDNRTVDRYRDELIREPLIAAVSAALVGSEKRAKWLKLIDEQYAIKKRKRAAADSLHKLKAEREYRLAMQEDGFAAAVVVLDEQIAVEEQNASRADRELEIVEPVEQRASRSLSDELYSAANGAGPILAADVRRRIQEIRDQLFETMRAQLEEIALLSAAVDNLRANDFSGMAQPAIFARDPQPQPDGEQPSDCSAPADSPAPPAEGDTLEPETAPPRRARPQRSAMFDLDG